MLTNPVLETLYGHKSDRSFTDAPLTPAQIDAIVKAGWRAPTSKNTQQVSVVVVQDAAARAQISACASGQPWIAQAPVFFCLVIDFHKVGLGVAAAGKTEQVHNTIEGLLSASTDAGIALGNMMAAAHSLGLGCVPIGGIRANPEGMIDLLKLPPHTFPLVGLTVGHIKNPAPVKPRMDMAAFAHAEHYDTTPLAAAVTAYDATIVAHWANTGRGNGQTWSASMAETYDHAYRPEVLVALKKQGFDVL